MNNSINKIMKIEHQKIDELIKEFENSKDKTTKDSQYLFNKFCWAIKEHFFMEEKIVFSVYSLDVDTLDNSELIDDHKAIFEILKKIEDKNLKGISEELSELIVLLNAHSKLEEDIFYDKLDSSLSDSEKKDIVKRAKEFLKN